MKISRFETLVCDVCGSSDIAINNGYIECKSCHTKYKLDELTHKLILEQSEEERQKKRIEDYLLQAKKAHSLGDDQACIEYCDKVLKLDENNAEAYLYRGIGIGYLSTLINIRINEKFPYILFAFKSANNMSHLDELADKAYKSLYQLFILLNKKKLEIVNSKESFNEYLTFVNELYRYVDQLQVMYISSVDRMNQYKKKGVYRDLSQTANIYSLEHMFKHEILNKSISCLNKFLESKQTLSIDQIEFIETMLNYLIPKTYEHIRLKDTYLIQNICRILMDLYHIYLVDVSSNEEERIVKQKIQMYEELNEYCDSLMHSYADE